MGAPGSGKGTTTPAICRARGITNRPIVISNLLKDGAFARALIDRGEMVDDKNVLELLLRELVDVADVSSGVLVDGFPRTEVQVECLKLLYDKMHEMQLEYAKTKQSEHFRRPVFRLTVLFVDESESVLRQLKRGKQVREHNELVRKTGQGEFIQERLTDYDTALIKARYKVFEHHYSSIMRLKKLFPFHLINAIGSVDEVIRKIWHEFEYQSSLELDGGTFEAIQNIPIADKLGIHARQELVRRLETYQKQSDLFQGCVDLIGTEFLPTIKRHAISGSAIVRINDLVDEEVVDIIMDILSERGYRVSAECRVFHIPSRIDKETMEIINEESKQWIFSVKFPRENYISQNAASANLNSSSLKQFATRLENEAFMSSSTRDVYLKKISSKLQEITTSLRQRVQQQQQILNAQATLKFNPQPPPPSQSLQPRHIAAHPQYPPSSFKNILSASSAAAAASTSKSISQPIVQPQAISPQQQSQIIILKSSPTGAGDVKLEISNSRKLIHIPGSNPLPVFAMTDIEKKSLKQSLESANSLLNRSSLLMQEAVASIKRGVPTDQSANLQRILRLRTLLNLQLEFYPQNIFFLSGNTVAKIQVQFAAIVQAVEKSFHIIPEVPIVNHASNLKQLPIHHHIHPHQHPQFQQQPQQLLLKPQQNTQYLHDQLKIPRDTNNIASKSTVLTEISAGEILDDIVADLNSPANIPSDAHAHLVNVISGISSSINMQALVPQTSSIRQRLPLFHESMDDAELEFPLMCEGWECPEEEGDEDDESLSVPSELEVRELLMANGQREFIVKQVAGKQEK